MFDDNHIDEFDRSLGSILQDGTEEVPERIWQGVSDGLDRLARRKTVVLWFRRAAVTSAAAAAIVLGLILDRNGNDTLVPASKDQTMIAVVEQETETVEETHENHGGATTLGHALKTVKNSTAMAEPQKKQISGDNVAQADHTDYTETGHETEMEDSQIAPVTTAEKPSGNTIHNDFWSEEDFKEEEDKKERIKASLILSGVAGTNSPQSKGGLKPFRSPAIEKAYTKTTVEQTSTNTAYGIPVSVGTGVKLDFNSRWSLGVGLNYTLLTSKFNGKYVKVNDDGTTEAPKSANVRNSQHYVGIPVNAYYNIMSRDFINFYAYAGGAVEKCVMNRYEVLASPVINHKEEAKGVQLSANIGIGVEFMINRFLGIYIDPSLRYYFDCNQAKSIRTEQPLMLGFEMGLRFNL